VIGEADEGAARLGRRVGHVLELARAVVGELRVAVDDPAQVGEVLEVGDRGRVVVARRRTAEDRETDAPRESESEEEEEPRHATMIAQRRDST
jgi:hypothetical protein